MCPNTAAWIGTGASGWVYARTSASSKTYNKYDNFEAPKKLKPSIHTFEPASSGRSKCRGCGKQIAKGELRFGERLDNPFAVGTTMVHWYHPLCAAMKRPEPLLEALAGEDVPFDEDDTENLKRIAELGAAHRRVPRIDGIQRSPNSRAKCRSCLEPIEKETWRIKLVFFATEVGMFNPSGYLHASCSGEYFETTDILDRIVHFSDELTEEELSEISGLLQESSRSPKPSREGSE